MGLLRPGGRRKVPDDRLYQRGEVLHPRRAAGRDALRAGETLRRGREGHRGEQSGAGRGAEERREHPHSRRGGGLPGEGPQVGAQTPQDVRFPLRHEGRDALRHFAAVRDSREDHHRGQSGHRPHAPAAGRTHPDPQEADRLGGRGGEHRTMGGVPAFAQQCGGRGHGLPHRAPGRDVLFALAPVRHHRSRTRCAQRRDDTRRPEGRRHDQGSRRTGPDGSAALRLPDAPRQPFVAPARFGRRRRIPGAAPRRTARHRAASAAGGRRCGESQLPRILPGLPAGTRQREAARLFGERRALRYGAQPGAYPSDRRRRDIPPGGSRRGTRL